MKALIFAFFLLFIWCVAIALGAGSYYAGLQGMTALSKGMCDCCIAFFIFVVLPGSLVLLEAIDKA